MIVRIVETGLANVASVRAALQRLGVTAGAADRSEDVESADAVLVPGVGAFDAGVRALRDGGFGRVLRERTQAGRPTLGICLGMQLFAERSAESNGFDATGLGVLPAPVVRLRAPRLPHFGWSAVTPPAGSRFLRPGAAYFAHSFCVADAGALTAAGFRVSTATEGGTFVAAVERDGFLACQFHPELSGAWGSALMGRWLEYARTASAAGEALQW